MPLLVDGAPFFIREDCARGDGRAEGVAAADEAVDAAVVMLWGGRIDRGLGSRGYCWFAVEVIRPCCTQRSLKSIVKATDGELG